MSGPPVQGGDKFKRPGLKNQCPYVSCVDSARAVMQNFDEMDDRSTRVHFNSGSRQL
jgi:hypothetical protein